jgi:hypothetical protein
MGYDSNLNWVEVKVDRPDEVGRVHAALSDALDRPNLPAPIDELIVVQFGDRHASEGVEDVRFVLEERLGRPVPEWIHVGIGVGNVEWMYGEREP